MTFALGFLLALALTSNGHPSPPHDILGPNQNAGAVTLPLLAALGLALAWGVVAAVRDREWGQ